MNKDLCSENFAAINGTVTSDFIYKKRKKYIKGRSPAQFI